MERNQPEEDVMMSIKEVTKYLKISRQTLHTLTKQGLIPVYKVGRSVRYKRSEVEEYLKRQKQ